MAKNSKDLSEQEILALYISLSNKIEPGKAPRMKVQLIRDGDTKEYAVIFSKGNGHSLA